MNKRKTLISLLLTFLILLVGMGVYKLLGDQKQALAAAATPKEVLREVRVQSLAAGTAAHYIDIDGRIAAYEQVKLVANVSGVLLPTSRVTKKGMFFKKGELLFDIDQRKSLYSLHAMRSSLLNAITLIMPDLKLDYPEAFVKWEQYLNNFEVEQAVQPLPAVSNKQVKYFVAARNIYNHYYTIKSAEAQLSDYQIYAPFSGVINQTDVFPGTMVMPGQPLASIMNTAHYELEAPITATDLEFVKVGNTVELTAAPSSKKWKGKVVRISNQIDPATQSIPVFIKVSGAGLKEGMYLSGQIKGALLSDVIRISKDLLVNQEYVFSLQDSTLHLQKLNIKNRDKTLVYASPMAADTWLVLEDPRGLVEGQKVRVVFEGEE